MQRKNNLLKTSHKKMRKGIAMIMAIAVIVIIATIMALYLALTTQTTKRTTDLYLYEQAVLLSQSAAEYGMLKASQQNPCSLNELNFSYPNSNPIYDVNISMQYISFAGTSCDGNATHAHIKYTTVTDPESDGTALMDITVSTKTGIATEPIRYFRRSIQKL